MLTDAAQALQHFSNNNVPPRAESTAPLSSGETRCFHLSATTLKHERDLLRRYRADDFQALLVEAHTLLVGMVKRMKNTHPDARLRGHSVCSLGSLLEQVSSLLLRMCNVYGNIERLPS